MASSSWISRGALALVLGIVGATACSSSTNSAACDSSQCAPGNKCLPLNGETKCRKTCTSNASVPFPAAADAGAACKSGADCKSGVCDPNGEICTAPPVPCPFGYTCSALDPEPFCVKDTSGTQKSSKGQWGAPCKASDGLDKNPACDTDQAFWCYGLSPTDGDAYCTRYDCTQDSDCGAGFFCGTVNMYPDVTTAKRASNDTEKVCLKRSTFCTPCKADLDCLPEANTGRKQHCVADDSGATFCAAECEKTENCPQQASCLSFGDFQACYPRAGVCVGDGSMCSPCRSNADCGGGDGLCLKGQYTTEKFCAKKSPSACATKGDCPAKPGNLPSASTGIGCQANGDDTVPSGYCVGVYDISGQAADIGCYTPAH